MNVSAFLATALVHWTTMNKTIGFNAQQARWSQMGCSTFTPLLGRNLLYDPERLWSGWMDTYHGWGDLKTDRLVIRAVIVWDRRRSPHQHKASGHWCAVPPKDERQGPHAGGRRRLSPHYIHAIIRLSPLSEISEFETIEVLNGSCTPLLGSVHDDGDHR